MGPERLTFFDRRTNSDLAGKISASGAVPSRAQLVHRDRGHFPSLLAAKKSRFSSRSVRNNWNGLRRSFWIQRLLGIPILCLGLAVLVLSSLVVLNSGSVSDQRISLCLTLDVLWKCMATRKVGLSWTSKFAPACSYDSKFSRLVLFG